MRCSTNTFEEKTSLHPLTISFPPPPSGCPALPVGRSALPLFSINAATQRADFFGRPWDLVIPVAGGTPHEPQISPAVSAPHPRGNGLGLTRKRLRPRPERRQQFAVVTVENDGSLLHSNIFKEINYPSYSIPIPMAFSSRPVFLSSRVRCWQPSSHQDAVETFRVRQMLRGRSRVSTCADRGSNE